MRKHKMFQRMCAVLLAFAMLLPANALAVQHEPGTAAVRAEDKLEPELKKALKKGEMTDFIVLLKDKADPALLADRAVMLADDLTPAQQEDMTRSYVVMGLQAQAEETQLSLLDKLAKAKASGEVEAYQSFYITNAIAVTGTAEAARVIAAAPEVESVILDEIVAAPPVEEEFSVMSEAELPKTPWNLTAISQDKVRDELKLDGTGVVVGIIDTGVDGTHPALQEGWRGNDPELAQYSWLDLDYARESKTPADVRGHGTHVCGTIMGRRDNNGNYLGVAPGAQWIAARVFDDEGASQSELIEAGQWMLAPTDAQGTPHPEMAPDIINNSWGGNTEDEVFYRDILKAWRQAGIVPVFSAGNASNINPGGPGSIQRPASFPEAFAVGALKKDDGLAKFSLRGPSEHADIKPDVSAPGVSIRSSMPGGKYGLMSGTSMASPHVAGAFALMEQAKPDATVAEMEEAMKSTCTPLTDSEYVDSPNNGYGYGKINVYNAVKKLGTETADFGTFSGHIYENGEDADSPVIQHAPIRQMFTSGSATPVRATVSDAGGVAKVTLKFAAQGTDTWTTREMKLVSGNKREGTFSADITRTELNEAGMQYQIFAEDHAGKTVQTELFLASVASGITIGYNQDFEENTDGMEFGGTTPKWEWGIPTSGPMAAKSGEKCVATNLDGNYQGLIDAIFVLPVIDLTAEKTGGKKAALSFNHWYDMGNYEYAQYETAEVWIAEVPEDDSPLNYQKVRSYQNSSKDWEHEYIDLAPYDGKKIYVMFGVRGILYAPQLNDGWYVDDIKVEEASAKIPDTPSKYLKLRYKPKGIVEMGFTKLDDPQVTSYCLYRSTSADGPFDLVRELTMDEIKYSSVTLSDIPKPQEGTYYYYATAKIGENEGKPTKTFSYTFTTGEPQVRISFEDGDADWTTTPDAAGNVWTYGEVTIPESLTSDKAGSVPTKEAYTGKNDSGMKMWATEPDDFRKGSATYTLESANIDLSGLTEGHLYYQNWFNTHGRQGMQEIYGEYYEFDEDQGHVYFSKDGGKTWTETFTLDGTALEDEGYNDQPRIINSWYTERLDIPAEYLTDQFRVKFELKTGKPATGPDCGGWYIDDVLITGAPAAKSAEAFRPVNMSPMGMETYGAGKLPLDGTVTILETGSKYYAEIGTGVFTMSHPAGTFTAVAEKKGYQPETFSVTIGKEPVTHDFILAPAAKNTVTVKVCGPDGTGLADAAAFLAGETDTFRVKANASGEITIPGVYADTYILNLSAPGYASVDQVITVKEGQDLALDAVSLEKLADLPAEEIAYDDGKPNSYVNSLAPGRVGAVLMQNNKPVVLDTVRFMFGTDGINSSEGKTFEYAIYEENGFDGLPGRVLVDFTEAQAGPDQTWTDIKVPGSVMVSGDFFVAYRQVTEVTSGTMLTLDEDNSGVERIYRYSNGGWYEAEDPGVYMIRAIVKPAQPEQDKPVLTSVTAEPSALTVQAGNNVMDVLNSRSVQLTLTYSDETTKQVPLTEWLTDAQVKLDGKAVGLETVFAADSKVITVEKEGVTLTLNVNIPETPVAGKAQASAANLRVDKFLDADGNAVFTADLKDPRNVYAVEFQVEGKGVFRKATGCNGMTVLTQEVKNAEDGTFKGTIRLGWTNQMLKADHPALTHKGLMDMVAFSVGAAGKELPALTVTLVKVAGAADLDHSDVSVVEGGSRSAVYAPLSKYDLDCNGEVNLGDLAIAIRCYRAASGDSDWAAKQKCDVNRDGVISVADFVEIAMHING